MNKPEATKEWRRFVGRPEAYRRWLKSAHARKQRRAARIALKKGDEPLSWRGLDVRKTS